MSYANGTQFYNLPQTVGTDKRDWFDTNAAFAAVDAALHAAATGQAADAEAISTINSKLAADEADIAALQTASTNQGAAISALQTAVNGQATQIADVRQDAEDMITANNEGAAATSSKAYSVGERFIYNDVLYNATAPIAIGDTIIPNTNCEATNVDTELDKLNEALGGKVIATIAPAGASDTVGDALHRVADFLHTLPASKIPKIKLVMQDGNSEYGQSTFNVFNIGRANPSAGYYSFDAVEYGSNLINIDARITGSASAQAWSTLVYNDGAWSVVTTDLSTLFSAGRYYIVE